MSNFFFQNIQNVIMMRRLVATLREQARCDKIKAALAGFAKPQTLSDLSPSVARVRGKAPKTALASGFDSELFKALVANPVHFGELGAPATLAMRRYSTKSVMSSPKGLTQVPKMASASRVMRHRQQSHTVRI